MPAKPPPHSRLHKTSQVVLTSSSKCRTKILNCSRQRLRFSPSRSIRYRVWHLRRATTKESHATRRNCWKIRILISLTRSSSLVLWKQEETNKNKMSTNRAGHCVSQPRLRNAPVSQWAAQKCSSCKGDLLSRKTWTKISTSYKIMTMRWTAGAPSGPTQMWSIWPDSHKQATNHSCNGRRTPSR